MTIINQHQQNSAAKLLNWVIIDKLHPTLLSAHLDKKWWPEILLMVNYFYNLNPSSIIRKTLYKAWYSKKPNLSHICIIGCTAYTKKIEFKHQKLADKKALSCKLLGYKGNHIYRLLTCNNRVIRSTNVKFVKQEPFKHIYWYHFYTPQLELSKADNTLDPLGVVSKARQLEESTCSYIPTPGEKTPEKHIDDYLLELELPATTTTRHTELPNPEHSSISEPMPSGISVSTQATKRQTPY